MGIKKGWTGLPFEYIGFSDLPNLAKERGLSVGLDLYGSFFGAILTRSQAYVSSTLLALSNAIGDKFFVVEDDPIYWNYAYILKLTFKFVIKL
jgi:hypothetical protein